MNIPDYTGWRGREFLFIANATTLPDQPEKSITPVRFEGQITGIFIEEKSKRVVFEISNRMAFVHGRAFPIVGRSIIQENGKRPALYFDSGQLEGYVKLIGEFILK